MTGSQVTRVVLAVITEAELDVEEHRRAVRSPQSGAEVVFTGVVRDHDHGRSVRDLEYVGHPNAAEVLREVAGEFANEPHVTAVAVSHRIGPLAVGEVALVAAVSTAHRGDAFAICSHLVDEVKRRLPIWKRQVFTDGSDEWVNCP
jgi:molybdopterin synthase catalytic subunit